MFQKVFLNNPEGRTKILVTNALHFLPQVDYIYTIADGQIMEQGTYAELMVSSGVFSGFLNKFGSKQEEEETGDVSDVVAVSEVAKREKSKKGPDAAATLERGGAVIQEEERSVGAVTWNVYNTYLAAGNGYISVPALVPSLILMQGTQVMPGYWLAFWREQQFHQPAGFYVRDVPRFPIVFWPDVFCQMRIYLPFPDRSHAQLYHQYPTILRMGGSSDRRIGERYELRRAHHPLREESRAGAPARDSRDEAEGALAC